jgi:hypothetical protein
MDGSRLTRQEASYWLAHEHNLAQRCQRGEVHYRAAPTLLGPQQPQFFGLAPHFLDRAGPTEESRYLQAAR